MKRAVVFLACILLLVIAGVAAWHFFSRKTPVSAIAAINATPAGSNTAFAPASESDPVLGNELQDKPRRMEEIVGIGAILKPQPETGAMMIAGVVPNSPAAAAGLAGNFLIRKIDGTATEGMKLMQCVELLRGVAGTKVRLELFDVDANEPRTVELTRQRIQVGPDRRLR